MAQGNRVPEPKGSDQLHPDLYLAILGLAVLFIGSAAAAFGDRYTDYLLVVVTGLFVVAMGIPYLLWLTWQHQSRANQRGAGSLREWSAKECQTWDSHLKGWEAAIQVLLPIAAVAIGMLAIGVVLLLVQHHVL